MMKTWQIITMMVVLNAVTIATAQKPWPLVSIVISLLLLAAMAVRHWRSTT